MQYLLIFILVFFMQKPAFSEELVEFKYTAPTEPISTHELNKFPNQSPWQDITNYLSITYFKAYHNKVAPTIILVHGSGGVAAREFHYAYRLQKLGFNIVIIDSFKPRGIISLLNSNRPALLPPQRAQTDIPDSVNWVRQQPWHSGSIGMLGWSHGGTTILEASADLKKLGVSGIVAFYPQASRWHNKTSVPTEIHHGTADDWTSYDSSASLSKPGLFSTPNPLIKLWSYEGAHHGFDHQGWYFRLLGWSDDGYRLRTVAPHHEAELSKKRTDEFFTRVLNGSN
jgi:dienelactone hydrolase